MTSTKKPKKPKGKPIKGKELKKDGGIKQKLRDLEENQDLTLKTPIDKVVNYLSEKEVAGGRNNFVYIRELEAISNLAVNVRKLAKFQKQDNTNKNYPRGVKNKQAELFNIYDQLLNLLTSECETFLTQAAKETINGKKDR